MAKKINHKVEDRLVYLHTLKGDLIKKQREWKQKYKGARITPRNPKKADYKTNTIFSIINAKKAEILSGIQEYDFIPLDDEGMTNVPLVKKIWTFEWLTSKTDKHLSKVVDSSCKYGDGFMYEGLRRIKRTVKVPIVSSLYGIEWEEKELITYDGIYCEYIPWENIYFDGLDIDDSNEAVWIKHWDRTEFIESFKLNPNYSNVNDELPIGRHYYIGAEAKNISIEGNINDENIISELRYYNKSRDQLIILANGIEVCNMAIPYKHKELPFCKFEDYKLDDRFYSMGEYELLEEDEEYKDALRSLNIDVIKVQMGFTAVDPDEDFDESTVEIGPSKFARVKPGALQHFSPNINASTIMQAEQAADNDIIIKSGIDFRSQILGPSETATKTDAKTQSARKRINLNLKLNGYSFFERLAKLRMSNIALLYSQGERKIPLKGGNIDENGIYSPLNEGYGSFVVKPEYVKGSFNVLPITESILGISADREKQNFLQWMQIGGNLLDDNGKPLFSRRKIGELLASKFGFSFDELTEQTEVQKTPKDLLAELDKQSEGVSSDAGNVASPDYIPPEQRSGARLAIPTLGSAANQ